MGVQVSIEAGFVGGTNAAQGRDLRHHVSLV
jgi:hypothetical protein